MDYIMVVLLDECYNHHQLLYVIKESNTYMFRCGSYLHAVSWLPYNLGFFFFGADRNDLSIRLFLLNVR